MKLLHCTRCNDLMALYEKPRTCLCGASSGHYTDRINAVVSGPCRVVGIINGSFKQALKAPERGDGLGVEFTAFIIPWNAVSIRKEESEVSEVEVPCEKT